MLSRLTEIAPLSEWALVMGAALLLLMGFVAYGHGKLVRQAYGERFQGPLQPGLRETVLRWSVILLAGGFLLWGVVLRWPASVLAALGAVIAVVLAAEGVARVAGLRRARQTESSSAE